MILHMIRLIENDEQKTAVEYIYKNMYRLMYQCAFDILKNHHDTEDAIMDVFRRIIDRADRFVGLSREATVSMVSIYTRNAAKTAYRIKVKNATSSLTVPEDEECFDGGAWDIVDNDAFLDRLTIQKETLEIVTAGLKALPEKQRDAILLKYYYHYRYADIGEALGISEGAARARVFRGREKMRELLGENARDTLEF